MQQSVRRDILYDKHRTVPNVTTAKYIIPEPVVPRESDSNFFSTNPVVEVSPGELMDVLKLN